VKIRTTYLMAPLCSREGVSSFLSLYRIFKFLPPTDDSFAFCSLSTIDFDSLHHPSLFFAAKHLEQKKRNARVQEENGVRSAGKGDCGEARSRNGLVRLGYVVTSSLSSPS
jgi:hypothetical protein